MGKDIEVGEYEMYRQEDGVESPVGNLTWEPSPRPEGARWYRRGAPNKRSCGYGAWGDMRRYILILTGVDIYDVECEEHEESELEIVDITLEYIQMWENALKAIDEDDRWWPCDFKEHARDRVLWMCFWTREALENCKRPVVVFS